MDEFKRRYYVSLSRLHYYKVSDDEKAELEKAESAIRNFLLDNSDSFRLTVSPIKTLRFKWNRFFYWEVQGTDSDPKFVQSIDALKSDLIKKTVTNERYQVMQAAGHEFEHYLFKLSPKMKELLNKETLIWYLNYNSALHCLEDPTFYKGEKLVGHVISHDHDLYLNLSQEERDLLAEKGVRLEEI